MDGKQLDKAIRETFNLKPGDPITTRQVNYMLQMLRPTNYLLAHHKIKGNPVTYNIPNHDETKALMHRPWQVDILNDMSQEACIIKSRQLGLSEVGVSQLIYFADTHSYDKVNCLYTFPKHRWGFLE